MVTVLGLAAIKGGMILPGEVLGFEDATESGVAEDAEEGAVIGDTSAIGDAMMPGDASAVGVVGAPGDGAGPAW